VKATVLWVGMDVPPDVRRANSPNKIFTGEANRRPDGIGGFCFVREFLMEPKGENHELELQQIP
jgi:hypothetical protein